MSEVIDLQERRERQPVTMFKIYSGSLIRKTSMPGERRNAVERLAKIMNLTWRQEEDLLEKGLIEFLDRQGVKTRIEIIR